MRHRAHFNGRHWRAQRHAHRCEGGKKDRVIFMHREIMRTPKGMDTDHVNTDQLDNRRCNLRICTRSQNNMNRMKRKKTSSKMKGVRYRKDTGKWQTSIKRNGVQITLGCFHSEIVAGKIYDIAAKRYFGEFARTNFL